MKIDDVRQTAFAMPRHSPSYPRGPYCFVDREYMTIEYETDMASLRRIIPEPLEIVDPVVRFEFVTMPDSTGFGAYHGASQTIPVRLNGESGGYTRLMFLDAHPPIAGGRELWGFPQKLAAPALKVERDTLIGKLDFGPARVASGSMGYKHIRLDLEKVQAKLEEPGFLLKIIPHVDGSPRICELVRYRRVDIVVKGAWTGPSSLELRPHALAPVADLPVLAIRSATHFISDYTLALGEVAHDYLG